MPQLRCRPANCLAVTFVTLNLLSTSNAAFAAGSIQAAAETQPPPLPEAPGSTIGYPNVGTALAGLHSKAGVTFKDQDGWTIAEDAAARTIWSFPPTGHPAYPSAVKRQIVEENGAISVNMSVNCEATKKTCDDLVRTFQELNAQMAAGIRDAQ